MPAGNLETQLSIVVTEMLIWSGSILPQVIQFNSIQFPNILVSIVPFNSRLNWIIESPGRFYPTGLWRMLLSPAEGCYLIGRIWTHTRTVMSNFFKLLHYLWMSDLCPNGFKISQLINLVRIYTPPKSGSHPIDPDCVVARETSPLSCIWKTA